MGHKKRSALVRHFQVAHPIRYAHWRWRALMCYTDDGLLKIDNNAAERALRCVALGRKNYLYCRRRRGRRARHRLSGAYQFYTTLRLFCWR